MSSVGRHLRGTFRAARRIGWHLPQFRFRDLEIVEIDFLGSKVPVLTRRTLVRMKRDTGRPQDQLDVARLRERFDLEDG